MASLGATRVEDLGARVACARGDEATGPLPRIEIACGSDDARLIDDTDFVVKGLLGEGGMGRVLVARQRSLGRDVAIKMLHEGGDMHRAGEMLLAEALITGSLEHPSIAPIHALGTDANGRPVLIMKRIEGVPWSTLLSDPRHEAWSRIEPDPAERLAANVDILMRVCDGIHYAHSRGVIHRDIKPSNVMVGSYGEVYVVDWGIAMRMSSRASMTEMQLTGTPCFMAPEMALSVVSRVDERTDVYLIGATLHAILTGQARHAGKTLAKVLASAVSSEPATYGADVPAELAAICNRACAADPKRRFESVPALRRALSEFLRHRSSVALCQRLAPRTQELVRLATDGTRGEPEVESRIRALLSECRFGYEQALGEWSSNPAAEVGLRRVLCVAVRLELAQGDAVGARAALAQLRELSGTPSASAAAAAATTELEELERRIAQAERHARARDAKLERLERDTDLRVGARQRAIMVLALMPFAMGMAAFVASSGTAAITRANMVAVIVLMNGALWLAIGLGQRKLLETAVNRRLVAGAAVMLAIWLANRIVGWAVGTPLNVIGATDLFVLAGVAGAAWAPQLRRFAVVSVLGLAAAIGATHLPALWATFFALIAIVVLATFASLFVDLRALRGQIGTKREGVAAGQMAARRRR